MALTDHTNIKRSLSYYPYYISFENTISNQSISPMTDETIDSNPEIAYSSCSQSVSGVTASSFTDTESVNPSLDPNSVNVWDLLPVDKFIDSNDNKKKWKCLDCKETFTDWNLTKTLFHVARKSSNDIRKCRVIISSDKIEKYESLFRNYKKKSNVRKRKDDLINTYQEENIKNAMIRHKSEKNKRSRIFDHSSTSLNVIPTSNASCKDQSDSFYPLFSAETKDNDDKGRMAIADFILSCGLPFRIAYHPKFRYMSDSMRNTSKTFIDPSRNIISN